MTSSMTKFWSRLTGGLALAAALFAGGAAAADPVTDTNADGVAKSVVKILNYGFHG